MAEFKVDAMELLDEQASMIGSLQKEIMILRAQLRDAQRQIEDFEAEKDAQAEPKDKPKVVKAVRDTAP